MILGFLGKHKLCRLFGVISLFLACWGDRKDSHLISWRQRLVSTGYRVNPALSLSFVSLTHTLFVSLLPSLFLSLSPSLYISFSLAVSIVLALPFSLPCFLSLFPCLSQK